MRGATPPQVLRDEKLDVNLWLYPDFPTSELR